MTHVCPADESILDRDLPVDVDSCCYQPLLDRLQGNILRSHGRNFTVNIFLEMHRDKDALRDAIADLARRYVTSARVQQQAAATFRCTKAPESLFGNLFLTHRTYEKLGLGALLQESFDPLTDAEASCDKPPNVRFTSGMLAAADAFNDPLTDPQEPLETAYRRDAIDAMLLLASDNMPDLVRAAAAVISDLRRDTVATVLAVEVGRVRRDAERRPIEHFGYVDGRSQPLFLASDFVDLTADGRIDLRVTRERRPGGTGAPLDYWNPFARLSLALLKDPGTDDPMAFGSYYVFRKLEQDVNGFTDAAVQLACELGLARDDWARAGAMIVGRFPDGTPLVLSDRPLKAGDPGNNFRYDGLDAACFPDPDAPRDRLGLKCPFQSHIRKVNPRQSVLALTDDAATIAREERCLLSRRIVRRGITYGLNGHVADDLERLTGRPSHSVGLLFACFQRSIARQFAFIQKEWVNSIRFLADGGGRTPTGVDPVAGQAAREHQTAPGHVTPYNWRRTYGGPMNEENPVEAEAGDINSLAFGTSHKVQLNLPGFVKFRGGAFFFAPSLPFLLNERK